VKIEFASNSYRLTRQAARTLDVVGRALSSKRLRDCQFVIEGHTDASGDDRYNLVLSRKRAAAVKRYLVARFNVDPNSLRTVGKGEMEPLFVNNPYAPQNRRVKIVNTGR
jgi:outer membrane protein OmpA-like peptidoglycan-associated protein